MPMAGNKVALVTVFLPHSCANNKANFKKAWFVCLITRSCSHVSPPQFEMNILILPHLFSGFMSLVLFCTEGKNNMIFILEFVNNRFTGKANAYALFIGFHELLVNGSTETKLWVKNQTEWSLTPSQKHMCQDFFMFYPCMGCALLENLVRRLH